MSTPLRYVFFGTGKIAATVYDSLRAHALIPSLVVTSPDMPQGRGYVLAPSPVKILAVRDCVPVMQPEKIDAAFMTDIQSHGFTVAVVVDYGKILPQSLIDIFPRGILNMHPSLLPRLRGASPIRSSILTDEKNTGVSVMLVDAKLDHGPIVAQKPVAMPAWPPRGRELDARLAYEGGELMAQILPLWESGEIETRDQNHDVATFCNTIDKKDAEIDLHEDAYQNLLKIKAYDEWPWAYTYFERGGKRIRTIITDAHIEGSRLIPDMVKPEGKSEMPYADFVRSGVKPLRRS